MTDMRKYTHTQGSFKQERAHAFQSVMMEVFTNFVNETLLNWIDDTLAFDKTFEEYIVTLRQFSKDY
jgi:hypothetical protein